MSSRRERKSRVGERVNMLTCLSERKDGNTWILTCLCDCGKTKEINQNWFRSLQSCGCIKAYTSALNGRTHGMSKSKEYNAWKSMKDRCLRETHPAYRNYGGRGISICPTWVSSFENFLGDVGLAPEKYSTLDRIDNEGDYCKENCRWVPMKVQSSNKRTNVYVEMFGETKTMSEWCEIYQVSFPFINYRVDKMGMTYEQAFTTEKGLFSKESKEKAGLTPAPRHV